MFTEGKPFINTERTKINLWAVDQIRDSYNNELVRVLLTKIKKKREGETVFEDTGAKKLDNCFNAFLDGNQS